MPCFHCKTILNKIMAIDFLFVGEGSGIACVSMQLLWLSSANLTHSTGEKPTLQWCSSIDLNREIIPVFAEKLKELKKKKTSSTKQADVEGSQPMSSKNDPNQVCATKCNAMQSWVCKSNWTHWQMKRLYRSYLPCQLLLIMRLDGTSAAILVISQWIPHSKQGSWARPDSF